MAFLCDDCSITDVMSSLELCVSLPVKNTKQLFEKVPVFFTIGISANLVKYWSPKHFNDRITFIVIATD